MKHTPEPWSAYNADGARIFKHWKIGGPDRRPGLGPIASMAGEYLPEVEHGNAERIVACVNGCAGFNPMAIRELVMAAEPALVELQQWHGWRLHTSPSYADSDGAETCRRRIERLIAALNAANPEEPTP